MPGKKAPVYSQVNFKSSLMNKRRECMAFGWDVLVLLTSPEFFGQNKLLTLDTSCFVMVITQQETGSFIAALKPNFSLKQQMVNYQVLVNILLTVSSQKAGPASYLNVCLHCKHGGDIQKNVLYRLSIVKNRKLQGITSFGLFILLFQGKYFA